MFPPEGNIGCVVDPELALDSRSPAPAFYLNYSSAPARDTPDTSFYQWVPFILVFQVLSIFCPTFIYMCYLQFISHGIPT